MKQKNNLKFYYNFPLSVKWLSLCLITILLISQNVFTCNGFKKQNTINFFSVNNTLSPLSTFKTLEESKKQENFKEIRKIIKQEHGLRQQIAKKILRILEVANQDHLSSVTTNTTTPQTTKNNIPVFLIVSGLSIVTFWATTKLGISSLTNSLYLMLGGGIGTVLRATLSDVTAKLSKGNFPYGTLAVNVIGSFVIGFLTMFCLETSAQLFFIIGICGAFTTFSTFILDTFKLIRSESTPRRAFTNIFLQVGAGLIAVIMGSLLGQGIIPGVSRELLVYLFLAIPFTLAIIVASVKGTTSWSINISSIEKKGLLKLLLLIIGGGIGAILRDSLSGFISVFTETTFIYGTLAVNIIGSFAIGLFATITAKIPWLKILLITGLAGSFTTFSTVMLNSLYLIQNGEILTAVINLSISIVIGLIAVIAGLFLGEKLTNLEKNFKQQNLRPIHLIPPQTIAKLEPEIEINNLTDVVFVTSEFLENANLDLDDQEINFFLISQLKIIGYLRDFGDHHLKQKEIKEYIIRAA